MSTKHLTATVAAALALSAITAGAAQARPAPGTGAQNTTGTVSKTTTHKVVRTGTYTPIPPSQQSQPTRTGTYTPVPPAPAIAAKSSDGTSLTLPAKLAGLFMIGIALIAVWAFARSGRRVRPLAD